MNFNISDDLRISYLDHQAISPNEQSIRRKTDANVGQTTPFCGQSNT